MAGAVVAGIVAKQVAAPVSATNGTWTFPFFGQVSSTPALLDLHNDGIGSAIYAYSTNGNEVITSVSSANNSFAIAAYAGGNNSVGLKATGGFPIGTGIQGFGKWTGFGVEGHGGDNSGTGTIGFGGAPNGQGTAGIGNGTGPGVVGVGGNFIATNNADGVQGFANGTGTGVAGYGGGTSGIGVNGIGGGPHGTGMVGTSSGGYGIVGSTTASGYSGLTGITGTTGVAALAATSTNINAYAAYFQGTTVVQGNFAVVGGNKSAAVKDASGQHRLVYCVESPESWFEDFGKAKLVNGHADVVLDKTFAEIVHTDDYHVFLTTYGASQGMDVMSQGASGFSVQERNKGTGSLTIGYRVVAKRKDIKGERLAKFDLPKINIPDESKLQRPEPPKKP